MASSPEPTACVFSYTKGGVPRYTSGITILAPLTSGDPSRTLPCNSFLEFAYAYITALYPSGSEGPDGPSTDEAASSLQPPPPTAVTYTDQDTLNSAGSQSKLQSQISAAAKDFINCPSYSAAHDLTSTKDTDGNGTAFVNSTLVPFEEYWCNKIADQFSCFPNACPGGVHYLYNLNETTKNHCMSLEKENYTSWAASYHTPHIFDSTDTRYYEWEPTLTPPCCNAYCGLRASAAQLLYWPTPAPVPNVSSFISGGHTFISPSVYVVYKDLAATYDCGTITSPTTVTVAYAPSVVKSFGHYGEDTIAEPIDYADLWSNCTSREANYSMPLPDCQNRMTQIGTHTDHSCEAEVSKVFSVDDEEVLHCYPRIAYPAGLETVNRAWENCTSTMEAHFTAMLFDPPRTLGVATALNPTLAQGTSTSDSAAPASVALASLPTKTIPPSIPPLSDESGRPELSTSSLRLSRDPAATDQHSGKVYPTDSIGMLESLKVAVSPPQLSAKAEKHVSDLHSGNSMSSKTCNKDGAAAADCSTFNSHELSNEASNLPDLHTADWIFAYKGRDPTVTADSAAVVGSIDNSIPGTTTILISSQDPASIVNPMSNISKYAHGVGNLAPEAIDGNPHSGTTATANIPSALDIESNTMSRKIPATLHPPVFDLTNDESYSTFQNVGGIPTAPTSMARNQSTVRDSSASVAASTLVENLDALKWSSDQGAGSVASTYPSVAPLLLPFTPSASSFSVQVDTAALATGPATLQGGETRVRTDWILLSATITYALLMALDLVL